MSLVATLVSNPADPALDADLATRAAGLVRSAAPVETLATGIAVDIALGDGLAAAEADSLLRSLVADRPVDVYVQPRAGRRKRLLIADMDSTMIGQECIDELAAEVGLKEHVAEITERAMRGELEFEPALRERVALLKDLPLDAVARVLDTRITLTPGARELVGTMRANGAYCALVSGGFTLFTGPVAERIGFDENRANILEVSGDRLAGLVREPILGREAKRERLEQLVADRGLSFDDTLAVGDGANDLAMIARAGLGVAYRAKPKVAAEADARVDHGDLTALLYFQGYRQADIRS
ncbi:phosphoserine phosphatase SerB [Microvirga tunisiensis]|uniref:Phosphoserine phosphatase SerB n=2 Tax=Pannonibacter tanglangensis TaxID=2750084 RepID=A0ABW9ZK19_9HYPH|nr:MULTISPECIES: phosphoserine phosphatase SerB [unclassified Pannonibacter]NBN63404.1 phosphoserine phosphatase SerB [Pannonibacter sp. XCT-34]NBN77039.1 phosphoserine phosphatase SerB [Pannonibacter sp. XCT-53]